MNTIIYHGNCPDGFAAAWLMNRYLIAKGETNRLVAGSYGTAPPDVSGTDAFLVDFCYEPEHLWTLNRQANSLTILDHHETATHWINEAFAAGVHHKWDADLLPEKRGIKVCDQNHSGAMLTQLWTKQHINWIAHVEDRDLWRFRMTGTPEVMAAILSHPYELKVYDKFDVGTLLREGRPIVRFRDNLIKQVAAEAYQADVFGHEGIWVCGSPYTIGSDVAGLLAERDPERFACFYVDKPNDVRKWGLRSSPSGINVADLAHSWAGGGGHPHAAGLETTRSYPS